MSEQLTDLKQCIGKTVRRITHCQWHKLAIVFDGDSFILLDGHTEEDDEWKDMRVSKREPSTFDLHWMGLLTDADFSARREEENHKRAESERKRELAELRRLREKYPQEAAS